MPSLSSFDFFVVGLKGRGGHEPETSPVLISGKGALHARVTRKWEVEMILNLGFWLWVQLELALKILFLLIDAKNPYQKILDPYRKS